MSTPPSDLLLIFIFCKLLPQNLVLKCLHFSPTARSLYGNERKVLQFRCCKLFFAPLSVHCVPTPTRAPAMCND